METVSSLYISKMFDSIIIEKGYDASYTTIHHCDCGHTFGGSWNRKYNMGRGYYTAAKYYTCPNCGIHSNPFTHKVLLANSEHEVVPEEMQIDVLSYKNFIDLRIRYKGIQLYWDGTSKVGSYKEILRFDFKNKQAVYINERKNKFPLTIDYIRDHERPIMKVLKYIGKSYAVHDVNKSRLAHLFKALRLEFEKRLTEQCGYKVKGVYIPHSIDEYGGYGLSMLVNMALKLSAPDMPPITKLIKSNIKWGEFYWRCTACDIPFNDEILTMTKKGIGFLEALRIYHKSPNSKLLRSMMVEDPMIVKLSDMLGVFKDENNRRTILTLKLDKDLDNESAKIFDASHFGECMGVKSFKIRNMWIKLSKRYGERNLLRYLLNAESSDVKDTVNMYSQINREYIAQVWNTDCKLKDFHDVVVNVYNKQEYGDVILPEVPQLQADVNGMHFMIPRTAADLMSAGKRLKNCVGSYRDRVMKGTTAIVLVTDDAMKPVACLELANKGKKKGRQIFDLVQAKLFANEALKKNAQINSTVMQWANQLQIEPHTIDVDATVV